MKFSRSWAIALWAATALVCDAANAQNFPSRPITVIMPFAGGSASDVVSRVLFNKMATLLGQPIVVENKPGAGGNLGTALAAKAAPDGYTLVGAASGPLAANLTLYKELGFDPQENCHDLAVRQLHHRGHGEQEAWRHHASRISSSAHGKSRER